MTNPRTIILGSTGMLGQQVAKTFESEGHPFAAFSRSGSGTFPFDYNGQSAAKLAKELNLREGDWIINCVGWIPQASEGDMKSDAIDAQLLNVELPQALEGLAVSAGARVLQVATDCVFSGRTGQYTESSAPDAGDLYGLSKALGETLQPSSMRIRASIVGPDENSSAGLFAWFLSQSSQRSVTGYTNHIWNGVTTLALSRLYLGIIRTGEFSQGCFHWSPQGQVSKYELLSLFSDGLRLESPLVEPGEAGLTIDRTLATNDRAMNEKLWSLAGYADVPTVGGLISEMTIDFLSNWGKGGAR